MRQTDLNKLTTVQVKNAPPGKPLSDGGGLYLRDQRWLFRYTSPITGKERDLAIGPTHAVPLKDARKKATEYRALLADDVDPRDHLAEQLEAKKASHAANVTFGAVAEKWMDAKLPDRKSPQNRRAIRSIIASHLKPLAPVPITTVTSAMIADTLKPLKDRPGQRDNVISLIHGIFDWAYAADVLPEGLNPARRKKLGKLIPKRDLVARPVRNNRFVPNDALPGFIAKLATIPGNLARCLEFIVHTGLRQNEAVSLRWDWVNLNDRSITIPGHAMKAKKAHTIYLAERPFAIIMGLLPQRRQGGAVFPGGSAVGGIGLRSLGMFVGDNFPEFGRVQIHGARAALKSYLTANTYHRRELIEVTLAHSVGGAVEAAYLNIGDLRKAREALYRDWSAYLMSAAPVENVPNIVPLKQPVEA
jgi:integrase